MDNMGKYAFKVCLAFKTKQSDSELFPIFYIILQRQRLVS